MSERKFTPGPWYCDTSLIEKQMGTGAFIETDDYVIARLDSTKNPCVCADATLIAAAPKMHEKLQHVHIYLVQSMDPEKRELADEIWAVLQEAEGRS